MSAMSGRRAALCAASRWPGVRSDPPGHGAAVPAGDRRRLAVAGRRRGRDAGPGPDAGGHRRRRAPDEVPSTDGKIPVDFSDLMTERRSNAMGLRRTQIFGSELEEFHKSIFQNPPDGGLISEAAAGYRDPDTARRLRRSCRARLRLRCDKTRPTSIGEWTADVDSLRTRPAGAAAATIGSSRSYWSKSPSARSPTRYPTS